MIKREDFNILISIFLFLSLIFFAFLISFWFGIFFVFGFIFYLYTGKIKKNPYKPVLIFIGGLIIRFSLEKFLIVLPRYSFTLDFLVALLIFIFLFLLGWKIKRA
ncbi:MAG: hypothetical protein KatS3mg001_477 [Candidatus Pacearchaeota archaeon]|nr:MAG: hypothetical protein KatS3mg001_477 [Candidatus Pacearchaeota archaeon]